MRSYHDLDVVDVQQETDDSIRVTLRVPQELAAEYVFAPGQHLPVSAIIDGKEARRTYSLCSAPGADTLQLGVRVQPGGLFSGWLQEGLKPGTTLTAMPPSGRFIADVDPERKRRLLAVAAGSGITPILAIARAVLEGEPDSEVLLWYGNRTGRSTMFVDDLYALKNRFPARLQLHFLFSREPQEHALAEGRLDAQKTGQLLDAFSRDRLPDVAYVCGPDTMIQEVQTALTDRGMPLAAVHSERFGIPRKTGTPAAVETPAEGGIDVTVLMDGHERRFSMQDPSLSLVDAAALAGIDLPFSCKGGVCATCRTHLRSGKVRMDANYGLEPWELEDGFILACQSHPETPEVTLDYDRA